MRLTSAIILLLFVTAFTISTAARNGKKKKKGKKPPQWKPQSMPLSGRKFFIVFEGESQTLDCKAKGKPKPKVTWFLNGQVLVESDNTQMKKSGELHLEGLTVDKTGNYTCLVENSQDMLNWTFEVKVQSKVTQLVLEGPNNVTASSGNAAKFYCRVLNDPQAEIHWYKGRSEDQNYLPTGDIKEELVLNQVTKKDEGVYGCSASNVWAKKSKDAYLIVIEPRPTVRTTEEAVTVVPWYSENMDTDLNPTGRDYGSFYTTKHSGGFFETDMYYTTKRPRNRNGGHKNRKDRKNRNKNRNKNKHKTTVDDPDTDLEVDFESESAFPNVDPGYIITSAPPISSSPLLPVGPQDENSDIWDYNKAKKDDEGLPDARFKDQSNKEMDKKGMAAGSMDDEEKEVPGSISSWTIYTIVGAVGGVILLIGLVAITLTLCLKREDGGVYKSTPV